MLIAVRIESSRPTHSRTEWTPKPPVSSRTRSIASPGEIARSTVSWSKTGNSGIGGYATRPVTRNGQRHPGRPHIELSEGAASPEEAAAIAAAIEQFLRDTAPPPPAAEPPMSPWLRAGLREATRPWDERER